MAKPNKEPNRGKKADPGAGGRVLHNRTVLDEWLLGRMVTPEELK